MTSVADMTVEQAFAYGQLVAVKTLAETLPDLAERFRAHAARAYLEGCGDGAAEVVRDVRRARVEGHRAEVDTLLAPVLGRLSAFAHDIEAATDFGDENHDDDQEPR